MTAYTISIGYLSGYSWSGGRDEAWEILKAAALRIAEDTAAIVREAIDFAAPGRCPCIEDCGVTLLGLAEQYRPGPHCLGTLLIDEESREVIQLASGKRELKEHVRRAFCRLLIKEMHMRGIEVNLRVS